MLLSDLKVGNRAIIREIDTCDDIKRRLLDMGLIKGTIIESLYDNISKTSVVYLVRGTNIAIRKSDGKNIKVELL